MLQMNHELKDSLVATMCNLIRPSDIPKAIAFGKRFGAPDLDKAIKETIQQHPAMMLDLFKTIVVPPPRS
jgi:hypothetical protein